MFSFVKKKLTRITCIAIFGVILFMQINIAMSRRGNYLGSLAHVGGAAGGIICALYFKRKDKDNGTRTNFSCKCGRSLPSV